MIFIPTYNNYVKLVLGTEEPNSMGASLKVKSLANLSDPIILYRFRQT